MSGCRIGEMCCWGVSVAVGNNGCEGRRRGGRKRRKGKRGLLALEMRCCCGLGNVDFEGRIV